MSISRADRSKFAIWWFTIDRALLVALAALIVIGLVLSLAASPAVAVKKGFPPYYFVERHILFAIIGAALMGAVSIMDPKGVRRVSLVILILSFAGLLAVHFMGVELNGARRWLFLFGHSIQPSEFLKPSFVVVSAWLFAEAGRRPDMPALPIAIVLYVAIAALLVLQPDVGQTILITLAWGTLFFVSGKSLLAATAIAVCGGIGLAGAYFTLPHVQFRIDRFLNPVSGDNSQVDRAMQSFAEGGFLGRGPGEGTVKSVLPDAHTDFIFAVVAEEYGAIACLILLALFGFIVLRAIVRAAEEPEPSVRLAVVGLAILFGAQALINMGVNTGLLPAKGMTLPFISAGGSSMLAVSLTAGLLLALTRRRADPQRVKKPRLGPTLDGLGAGGETVRQ
jgi:cell division protein FtsW